jgi:hypothetical protein
MKYIYVWCILWIAAQAPVLAQVRYSGKVEVSYFDFRYRMVQVDPGPGWKGYNLNQDQNGIGLTSINGLDLVKDKLFAGVGLSYLNYENTHGMAVFSDVEYAPLNTRLTPLLNMKFGYSHIWNQYDGGSGTGLVDFGGGLRYRVTQRLSIYARSGVQFAQQCVFIPVSIGVKF